MEKMFLNVEVRAETGRSKVKALRDKGFIPAVIYGEGKEGRSVQVSMRQLFDLVHKHRLENALVTLKIEGEAEKPCLIKDIQLDPLHEDIIHVDFNSISMDKKLRLNVPIIGNGEPAGVKQEGGSLEHILWEIEVECLPTDIPEKIEVDISGLKLGESIHVKDLNLPSGVKALTEPESVLFTVAAPTVQAAEEEAAAEGEAKAEPEVIKEKKETPAEESKDKEKK